MRPQDAESRLKKRDYPFLKPGIDFGKIGLEMETKKNDGTLTDNKIRVWRRGSESNRRIRLLQSPALPLGYPAVGPRLKIEPFVACASLIQPQ